LTTPFSVSALRMYNVFTVGAHLRRMPANQSCFFSV
jgi:hypothetical protein